MQDRKDDLRDCPTAFECRDRLPGLSGWLSDDDLKLTRIWAGARFERGQEYFDLDNPARGPFIATGDEGRPTDQTYVNRLELPEHVWAKLVTWQRPLTRDEFEALDAQERSFRIGQQRSAAGEADPIYPEQP